MKLVSCLFGGNTTVTDNPHNMVDSTILKPKDIHFLDDIVDNGQIIYFTKLAKRCHILPINAGRTTAGLNRNIKADYVKLKKLGKVQPITF